MNIVLTGYMGSGKTAVGTYIAKLCGLEFVDTDALVEEKCGMPISKIFKTCGEAYFRVLESEIIKEVSLGDSSVISTGGGVVLNEENVAHLRKNGVIVNLDPDEAVIRKRLSGEDTQRPLISGSDMDEILKRFNDRKPYYDNCDIKIKITNKKGISETAEEILNVLEEKYEGKFWSSRK